MTPITDDPICDFTFIESPLFLCGKSRRSVIEDLAKKGDQQKILVVEDDEYVRRVTVSLLVDLNYDVVEANNGPSALRILAELGKSGMNVDLVFSDVLMPFGMNGIDLSIAIWGKFPNIPVVLTSGFPDEALRDAGLGEEDLRQIRLLRKPYSRQLLSETIAEVLNPGASGARTSDSSH